ncbi:hypothetical protein Rwratislav_21748, partial [Rhodococcus wratislaviensis IFP 2016]
ELVLGRQPEEVRRAVLWDNAARLYGKAMEKQGVNPSQTVAGVTG